MLTYRPNKYILYALRDNLRCRYLHWVSKIHKSFKADFDHILVQFFVVHLLTPLIFACLDVQQAKQEQALLNGIRGASPNKLKRTMTNEKLVLPTPEGKIFLIQVLSIYEMILAVTSRTICSPAPTCCLMDLFEQYEESYHSNVHYFGMFSIQALKGRVKVIYNILLELFLLEIVGPI